MDELQKEHLSIVNSSGFPFQSAVTEAIKRSPRSNWRVVLKEHPWRHPDTLQEGYIDLVLEHKAASIQYGQYIILECKRQRGNARWYFLPPITPRGRDVRILLSNSQQSVVGFKPCDSFLMLDSPESSFCVVPGEGSGRRPLLEKMTDDLLQSLEAFALEDRSLNKNPLFRRLYLPVVVTNARLFTCSFDPVGVSLETGEIPDEAKFEEVPYIRFKKTLWSHITHEQEEVFSVEDAHQDRERTILVVSGSHLKLFLEQVQFGGLIRG